MDEQAQQQVAEVKSSGLAIWSLVLGILGIICLGPLGAVPAVICGHMALPRIAKSAGHLTGQGLAIAGLVTGYLALVLYLLILPGLMLPAIANARERAHRIHCINNLKQVMVSLYMYEDSDGKNKWPDDLAALSETADYPKLYVCPSAGSVPGALGDVMHWTDYTYVQGLSSDMPGDRVALFCRPENHDGEGANVAFVDGHVEWVSPEDFRALVGASP